MGILAVFLIELFVLLCALQLDFFRNPLYVLDLVVICASLAIEVSEENNDSSMISTLSTFWYWCGCMSWGSMCVSFFLTPSPSLSFLFFVRSF